MVATVGSIAVAFSADLTRYEASLRRGERATDQATGRMGRGVMALERRFAGLGKGLGAAAFGGLAAGATAALAPILSLAGALAGAKAALTEFDRIGKAAKAGGLDAEFYQELAHAAELGGVSTDQFSKALETFAKNSGLAAEGKGRMVTALKSLNPELLKAIQNATSQAERIRIVADALDKETDASRKAAIAAAAFGDAGIRMVEMLKGGSAALDETARQARNLGIVVDRHLIARAEELNDEFSTAMKVVDLQFKQALINLAPVLVATAQLAARLAGDIRSLVDAFRDLENRSSQSLDGRMRSLGLERLDVENRILELKREQNNLTDVARDLGFGANTAGVNQELTALESRLQAIADEEAKILGILNSRKPVEVTLPTSDPIDTDTGGGGGRASTRNAAAEAALREAEAVKQLIAELQFERDQIGLTDLEKRTNETLRRAGAAATVEEREQIKALVAEIERETAALEANKQAQEQRTQAIESLFQMGGDALMSIVDGSMKAEDALKRLIVQLAQAALQAALLGSGPLAGLFNGIGGTMLGKGWTLPEMSGGGAVRVDHLSDNIGPCVDNLRPDFISRDRNELDVPADAMNGRQVRRGRVDVFTCPHGFHDRQRVGPQAIAA